jgi:predicted nucleotide-binding protein (sugar kinase/HSP70/actin superfamily)
VANGKNKKLLNPKVIGIPKGLSFFLDVLNWEEFFNILGYKVLYSENSSVEIFELGNKYAGSDQCFPVKVYYGHVISLLKKTNNIFIPQYISFQQGTYCCPKVIGLPSMIRNSIPQEFNLITAQIDLGKLNFLRYNILRLALKLSVNPVRVLKAFRYFTVGINRRSKGFNVAKQHVNK